MTAAPAAAPKKGALAEHAAERRVQMLALGSLIAAVVVDAALVGFAPTRFFGVEVPAWATLVCLVVALVLGIAAVVRRDLIIVGVAVAAFLLPALTEREWNITPFRFFGSVIFGFLVLAFGELVHMTTRYEKWHAVAEEAGTGSAALDHATEEYLRTFTTVFGASTAVAIVIGLVFFALVALGPAQHRASLDFRSFYGLIGAAALVFGGLALYALARGADWSWPQRGRSRSSNETPSEVVVDVHE